MLRVIYDHQIFAWQRFGGISRYYYELAKRVGQADGFSASVVAPLHVNDYLAEGGVDVRGLNIPKLPRTERAIIALNRLIAPVPIRACQPDLLHETYYAPRSPGPGGCAAVVTVFDMIHEKLASSVSSLDKTSLAKQAAVERADCVICISENTRRDLIEIFGVAPEKARTIHLGFSLTKVEESGTPEIERRPFILYVGQRAGYKNFDKLLAAYASSKTLPREFALLAFGGGAFTKVECERIRQLGLDPASVRQISGDDAVLASLYRKSAALVYPSLYEGFGIPPLEAMSFDCPVVCSNTSSIPEVVGDAAYLFDPADVDAMRDAIESMVTAPELRSEFIRRGRERLSHFSWDRCASDTMQVYREVAMS
jgi:glycosyltransferase involved in cell wall biosynthesis